jgi:hypothetical protein
MNPSREVSAGEFREVDRVEKAWVPACAGMSGEGVEFIGGRLQIAVG